VVLGAVAGEAPLDPRPQRQDAERDPGEQDRRPEHLGDGEAEQRQGPRRAQPQRAVQEADVPVGLRRRGHVEGTELPVLPHGVDLRQAAQQRQHGGGEQQQRDRLEGLLGPEPLADHVALAAAPAAVLGVLLQHQDEDVDHHQADQQRRQQHHVEHEQPRDDVAGGELAAEQQEGHPGADQRDRQRDRVEDPQADAAEQVVGQRVAGEALAQGQEQQRDADQPVDLAGPAEGAGEEDAAQVDHDRGHEHQRRPVVHLAHQQPGADLERQPQHRVVGGRDLLAPQRLVGAVVDHLADRRVVEEGHEDAGEDQHHQAEQGDLAEQERPVVGEDLAHRGAREAGGPQPLVEVLERALDHHAHRRS
jgi:hypothetical protein